MTKDELRAELERQAERYKDVYGGEVTTYAAQTEPERKPWRKRASLRDQAFSQELERMERNYAARTPDPGQCSAVFARLARACWPYYPSEVKWIFTNFKRSF